MTIGVRPHRGRHPMAMPSDDAPTSSPNKETHMISQSSNLRAAHAALEQYTTEDERRCFAEGYRHGHGIVCHISLQIGQEIVPPDETCPMTVTSENYIDVLQQLALAAEENARCYTPWEQTAAYINDIDCEDSLHYWNIYDEGVMLAIAHDCEGLEHGVH